MFLYSLLKTQQLAIPLSVTVSKAKNFTSPFLGMMIKPGKWKVKNELQKNRRKINGLKASNKMRRMEVFILKFISRAIEISRQFCASSNSFFYRKNSTVAPVPTTCFKRSKSPLNFLNSGLLVGLRFKICGSQINAQLYDRAAFSFLLVCN